MTDEQSPNPTGAMSSTRFWEEQSQLYARELRNIYQSERSEREALKSAQSQLLRYAEDIRAAFRLERELRQAIQQAYLETIRMLAAAVEARDPCTGGHLERVTKYSLSIARELGWDDEAIEQIEMGAILHDIGKISVEDAILRKPGPLSTDEWQHMRRHPETGAHLLRGIGFLTNVIPCVLHHHERFDGRGYPAGLRGEEIPIGGRIVAVADAFDAMTSTRPYRPALPDDYAIHELQSGAGVQWDPRVVAAFLHAYSNRSTEKHDREA